MTKQRLSTAEMSQALSDFVEWKLGAGCSDEAFAAEINGCEILYRDDYDTEESFFQVVDAQGHGDGTGAWYAVKDFRLAHSPEAN